MLETGFSAMVLKLVSVVGDTAVRMTALLLGCGVLIAIAALNREALLPALAIVCGAALLWRPVQLFTRRVEDVAPGEAAYLRRQVALLSTQVEQLQREQRQLQAVVRWQENLLQQLVHEHEEPPARQEPTLAPRWTARAR